MWSDLANAGNTHILVFADINNNITTFYNNSD